MALIYIGSCLLFFVLLGLLVFRIPDNTSGDSVQILLSDRRHSTAAGLDLFHDFHFFQLEQNGSDNARVGLSEVLRAGPTAVIATVPLLQLSDSNPWTQIYLPRDGGGADVVPVVTVGRQFLEDARFDRVGPNRKIKLVRVLQVLGVGFDKIRGRNVSHTDPACFFRHGYEAVCLG